MVACYLGVVEVAGSNPVVPIFFIKRRKQGLGVRVEEKSLGVEEFISLGEVMGVERLNS